MRIKELLENGLITDDHWLLKAKTKEEDVIILNGRVIWKNGTWKYGVWESGTWKYGVWESGTWESGTWESGFKSFGRCKWSCYYSKDKIKIGCETKSVKKWKKWLDSDKEFETKREDPSFKSIENTIRLGIAIVNTLKL